MCDWLVHYINGDQLYGNSVQLWFRKMLLFWLSFKCYFSSMIRIHKYLKNYKCVYVLLWAYCLMQDQRNFRFWFQTALAFVGWTFRVKIFLQCITRMTTQIKCWPWKVILNTTNEGKTCKFGNGSFKCWGLNRKHMKVMAYWM